MVKANVAGGFTLIELLVVITIIVVLLALLTPAMDEAMYQAELTVCGAHLNGVADAGLTYAMGHQRRYPSPGQPSDRAHMFLTVRSGPNLDWDLRPMLRDYMDINGQLQCPLTESVDFESPDGPLIGLMADYSLWFGWRYLPNFGTTERGMNKVGDRFTWSGNADGLRSFSLLANDWNDDMNSPTWVQSSHPDRDDLMRQIAVENVEAPWLLGQVGQYTFSWWERSDSYERGLIDRNFAYDDASVIRVRDQKYGDGVFGPGDERMTVAPVFIGRGNTWPNRKTYLPRQ